MRVAFEYLNPNGWMGGLNYMKNVLAALQSLPGSALDAVILTPHGSENRSISELQAYGCTPCALPPRNIRRWRASWWRLRYHRLLRTMDQMQALWFDRVCSEKGIDVVFQASGNIYAEATVSQLAWIPDFQHLRLPELFSAEERQVRDHLFAKSARFAKRVILSSRDAQDDFVSLFPEHADKARVLSFVAHVPKGHLNGDLDALLQKYHLPEKFFYLPNQFWRHKNHEVVFRAISILKKKGMPVTVVCSGHPFDYRDHKFAADLIQSLSTLNIRDCVTILGLVPQEDVYALIRQSIAILNPSRFEGWSTSVEECKSVGKRVILSELKVHKEQAPPNAAYFTPDDAEELTDLLAESWTRIFPGPDRELEERSQSEVLRRQQAFANAFIQICSESRHV